jgi:hypothetical protein
MCLIRTFLVAWLGVFRCDILADTHKGVMEILWIGPYQSKDAIPKSFFDLLRRGNLVEIHFRFISSSFPLNFQFPSVLPN